MAQPDRVASHGASLGTIIKEWTRLGCTGFGGPPTHIALLRRLCVTGHRWIDAQEFEDAIATTNLLPGPASTQLAIYCAWRLQGVPGALVGGFCFIAPGLALIIGLASVFLAHHPPLWVLGAAAGGGAAVPAVALHAATQLTPQSRTRIGGRRVEQGRWILYAALGASTALLFGQFVVLALLGCGAAEACLHLERPRHGRRALVPIALAKTLGLGGLGALSWVALKVGALSYGGGFVIIPLMQHDVVTTYHWMTGAQFLNAVALGQVTPGPVIQTIAVVGYAAGGVGAALLAALIAFGPSFAFIVFGAPRFAAIRSSRAVTAFLSGAGPCVVGAIAGSAVALGVSLERPWQFAALAFALLWLYGARRGVVSALLLCAGGGVVLALVGVAV